MRIPNLFLLNDCDFKSFLIILFAFHCSLWGIIEIDIIGIHIPIIRGIIGTIFLLFVPGVILLRVLKLHNLKLIEAILFIIGLSISTIMFLGLLLQLFSPLFGIQKVFSSDIILFSITISNTLFVVLAYFRDKNFKDPKYFEEGELLSSPVVFSIFIIFCAIIGTYLVNEYDFNVLLIILLLIVSLIPIIIVFTDFIKKKYYPILIFSIALSLLFHTSLVSHYIWGWDIHQEFFLINAVVQTGFWDYTINSIVSGMLSIVILGPFFSFICDIPTTSILKIIYPFLYAFVPLGLFLLFKQKTNDRIAFLACFFFCSVFTFYIEMPALARQEIAELFLVLFLIVLFKENFYGISRNVLLIIFSLSIVISHYGLACIFLIILIISGLFIKFLTYFKQHSLMREINLTNSVIFFKKEQLFQSKFSFQLILVVAIFLLIWNIYVANSISFNTIVTVVDSIGNRVIFVQDFLNPQTSQGLSIITQTIAQPLHNLLKWIHLLFIFFICVGIITLLIKSNLIDDDIDYISFSLVFFCIAVCGIILPWVSNTLNTSRLYHMTLIILSVVCIIGAIFFISIANSFFKKNCSNFSFMLNFQDLPLKILTIILSIFLLLNTGLIFELTGEGPNSIALSQKSVNNSTNFINKLVLYNQLNVFPSDISGMNWIISYSPKIDSSVFVDRSSIYMFTSYGMHQISNLRILSKDMIFLSKEDYVFLSHPNSVGGIIRNTNSFTYSLASELTPFLEKNNLIYQNGESTVYSGV